MKTMTYILNLVVFAVFTNLFAAEDTKSYFVSFETRQKSNSDSLLCNDLGVVLDPKGIIHKIKVKRAFRF